MKRSAVLDAFDTMRDVERAFVLDAVRPRRVADPTVYRRAIVEGRLDLRAVMENIELAKQAAAAEAAMVAAMNAMPYLRIAKRGTRPSLRVVA